MPARDKYTDPELRDQVKEEIHASDKGGRPGQWSARKAQLMASEYKKRGGGYTTDKETGQDESQKHLSKWTEEEWQTKEGDANATKDDGTKKRYLPKKAWENMSEDEKEETEKKKEEGEKQGKQYVGNTEKAKRERRAASKSDQNGGSQDEEDEDEDEHGEGESEDGGEKESKSKKKGNPNGSKNGKKSDKQSESQDANKKKKEEKDGAEQEGSHHDDEGEEDGDFVEDAEANQEDEEECEDVGPENSGDEPHGQKRVHTRQDDKVENKKQKTNGEGSDEEQS